jgi:hypothetical protein
MKEAAAASLALATLIALAGCSAPGAGTTSAADAKPSASSSAPTKPQGPTVGVPFTFKQNDGVAKVTIVSVTYGASDGSQFATAAQNGGYLILDVLWQAESGTASANPFYVTAKDSAGHAGDPDLFVPTALATGDVPVGDKSRGNVAFDIAPGPVTIILSNQGLQEVARLTVTPTAR